MRHDSICAVLITFPQYASLQAALRLYHNIDTGLLRLELKKMSSDDESRKGICILSLGVLFIEFVWKYLSATDIFPSQTVEGLEPIPNF
jgi:hypothetical protein